MRFEWDPAKAHLNVHKHGITFDLATQVFDDPFHILVQDRIENREERWQTIGQVRDLNILLVAHTIVDTEGDEIVRIISARRADSRERRLYEREKLRYLRT